MRVFSERWVTLIYFYHVIFDPVSPQTALRRAVINSSLWFFGEKMAINVCASSFLTLLLKNEGRSPLYQQTRLEFSTSYCTVTDCGSLVCCSIRSFSPIFLSAIAQELCCMALLVQEKRCWPELSPKTVV